MAVREIADIEAERNLLREKEALAVRRANIKAHITDWVSRMQAQHTNAHADDKAAILAAVGTLQSEIDALFP